MGFFFSSLSPRFLTEINKSGEPPVCLPLAILSRTFAAGELEVEPREEEKKRAPPRVRTRHYGRELLTLVALLGGVATRGKPGEMRQV